MSFGLVVYFPKPDEVPRALLLTCVTVQHPLQSRNPASTPDIDLMHEPLFLHLGQAQVGVDLVNL